MKTILVTGASSGIGEAIASRLLDDGYSVYVAARRLDRMQHLADRGAIALAMDIARDDDIRAVVDRMTADGGLDVLINNAGFATYGAMEDTPIADARYQFEVNLFGLARLTQLLLPGMRSRGSGTIVNMSSMGGKIYTPLGSWYHATKHALEGWSDCLRIELAPFGIDVIIIEPGAIETEFDNVMIAPMLERSGATAYAAAAKKMAASARNTYRTGNASPPSVIADIVLRAVTAPRPKTRYVAGKHANTVLFVRRWFSDRFFDRLITRR